MKELLKSIIDIPVAIYKNSKILFLWLLIYFLIGWTIFYFIFGFNIFSINHWNLLHLAWTKGWTFRGLIDITFFISLLSFVPIMIATSIMMTRGNWWSSFKNWLPVITIPALKTKSETSTPTEKTEDKSPENTPISIPNDLPAELAEAYIITTENGSTDKIIEQANYNEPESEEIINPDNPIASAMLPKDFNIDPSEFSNLDNDEEEDTKEQNQQSQISTEKLKSTELELNKMGFQTEISDNLIIANKTEKHYIIATHQDEGTWLADDKEDRETTPLWFTEGTFKVSPIYELEQKTAELKSLNPKNEYESVLYLETDDILNFSEIESLLDKKDIKIVKSLSELN